MKSASAPREKPAIRLWQALFTPIDIASLAVFRIGFGLLMAWECFRYLESGSVKAFYVDPKFYFTFYGFEWVKPWAGKGMYMHLRWAGVLAACMPAPVLLPHLGGALLPRDHLRFLLDQTHYLNHFYLICLLSFVRPLLPAHRPLAVDAFRTVLRSDIAPAWSLWLLRAQIAIVYFFGGIAKLNADWLHGEPMRMWLPGSIRLPGIEPLLAHPATALLISWGGLLLDLLVVPARCSGAGPGPTPSLRRPSSI